MMCIIHMYIYIYVYAYIYITIVYSAHAIYKSIGKRIAKIIKFSQLKPGSIHCAMVRSSWATNGNRKSPEGALLEMFLLDSVGRGCSFW